MTKKIEGNEGVTRSAEDVRTSHLLPPFDGVNAQATNMSDASSAAASSIGGSPGKSGTGWNWKGLKVRATFRTAPE